MKENKLVFIFGPTGVGKSDIACEVAQGIGEIISVDSMQVYWGMERGTAKPTEEQMQRVKHYLVSIVPPDFRFSAGNFKKLALKTISDIYNRGKIPILVGGTGLYFRALEFDLMDAPPANLELRDSLYSREEKNSGSLYRALSQIDPQAASSIHPNDILRVVRALEIYYITGVKFSELTRRDSEDRSVEHFTTLKIGINTDRDVLYGRIEARCMKMIDSGLAREVFGLLRDGYTEKLPSMKGLGYSHFIQYFKGCYSSEETVRLFIRDTKRYAKRQLTWFGKEPDTRWFEPSESEAVKRKVMSFLSGLE